jgi:hypothetical protein
LTEARRRNAAAGAGSFSDIVRRPKALAAGLASIILLGSGIAGGFYIYQPSVYGIQAEEAQPAAVETVDDTNSTVATSIENTDPTSENTNTAETVDVRPDPGAAATDATKAKQPAETQASADKPVKLDHEETMFVDNDDGSNVRVSRDRRTGAMIVTERNAEGKITRSVFRDGTFPFEFPRRPPNAEVPKIEGIEQMTPSQRRRLKAALKRHSITTVQVPEPPPTNK